MLKLFIRLTLGFIAMLVMVAVTGPWALYWIGLNAIDSMPSPPSALATTQQQAVAWKRVGGQGEPSIAVLNPYTYILTLKRPSPSHPGVLAAWLVARKHLLVHRRHLGMGWWHLSGAALTIWITRHWSSEQILTAEIQPET